MKPWGASRFDDAAAQTVAAAGLSLDFTTGLFPPTGVTTSNSTGGTGHNDVGTYFNSSNVLTLNSGGGLRADYLAFGSTRTLLYEKASTNLFLQSNNFTTGWTIGSSAVLTGAQFTSPDGTNNGWSMTNGTGFGSIKQYVLPAYSVPYAMSMWAKNIVSTPPLAFMMETPSSSDFSLSSSAVRHIFTTTPAGINNGETFFIDSGAAFTAGIFGAQVEAGSVMTSYIPTTTASLTRAADTVTFTIPSGVGHLTVTFDDNSTQSIAVSPGSYTLTTALTRPNVKTIVGAA